MGLVYLDTVENVTERVWAVEGIPVLSARLSLPQPAELGKDRRLQRIARYYRQFGRAYLRYCERFLLPQAAAEFRQAVSSGGALPQFSAQLSYRVTWNDAGLWSLCLDARERGALPLTVRRSDTWDLRTGVPVPLSDFFPPHTALRRLLPPLAVAGIRQQLESGTAVYRDEYAKLARRAFSPSNFYVSPEGLYFFYQMYALAPAAEGIPAFEIPWDVAGARLPPWMTALAPQLPV